MDPTSSIHALPEQQPSAQTWAIGCVVGYLVVVALLRHRRLHQTLRRFDSPRMTDDDAWEILRQLGQLEFPFTYQKALQFALFRTYGIPTISKLLVKTSEFSSSSTAMKRYADTAVLIAEFMAHAPSSPRSIEGIARMNYLHHGYRSSGKILDDDMLYTLSLFALEPPRWIDRYEWRKTSHLEKCAFGTYWKSMGDAMQISYERLPSYKVGFRDGLQWLEEIDAWSQSYEKKHMIPDENNKKTADETVAILLWSVPEMLHRIGRHLVCCLMGDRLRTAMMYEKPNWLLNCIVSGVLSTRKLALRYLSLPRPSFLRLNRVTEDGNEKGPHFLLIWESAPYYAKPTIWNRWGPGAWTTWLRGLPLPGDDGATYYPNGYHIKDVGPKVFEGKGTAYIQQTQDRLQRERTGSCPFAVAR